jgi:hypothetical protein
MNSSTEQFNHLTYKFYFKEDDKKSRLFDDTEEDLQTKLIVIIFLYNLIYRNYPSF